VVVTVVLHASRPMARQSPAAMMPQHHMIPFGRNFAVPIEAVPTPNFTTLVRASIMFNLGLFSMAKTIVRRPTALPPGDGAVSSYYPCLILIPLTLHVHLRSQHPRTHEHHCLLPLSCLVSRPRLPLAMSQLNVTRRQAQYSITTTQ